MRRLIEYFVDNSILVNIISVMIFVVGIISAMMLNKEIFPDVDFGVIVITTTYTGSSSEDVEKLVTIPIERSLKGIDGIKEMNAMSLEGQSIIYLKLKANFDTNVVYDDVKNELDTVDDLPDEAKLPRVRAMKQGQRSVIRIGIIGKDENSRREAAKELETKFEQVSGVAKVETEGLRDRSINVAVDLKKLNDYQLTVSEIRDAINKRHVNLSAGNIELGHADIMVRTLSEFSTAKDIENVVVRSGMTGRQVKVKDISNVSEKLVKADVLVRGNGEPAIYLSIKKSSSVDTIKLASDLKETAQKFIDRKENAGLNFIIADDLSFFVKRRLNVLTENGLQGMFLVFICLMFFLNFRASVVTSLGAPLAFMIAFALMEPMGVSFNLISMFGLILVLGMLVDDSIIVAEQYYQKLEDGMPRRKAAIESAIETAGPVLATILTTIVAFGSLFFMGGIMGKFLWPVPAVVILCLVASYFECFFILPNHLCHWVKPLKTESKERWYKPLYNAYEKTLSFSLKKYWLIIFGFISMFALSMIILKGMKFELFPGDDVRVLYYQIKGPIGTPLSETDEVVTSVEKKLLETLKKEEFQSTRTTIGIQRGEHGNKRGPHYATIIIYLTNPVERERSTDEIVKVINDQTQSMLGKFEGNVRKLQGGPPKGKPVDIELRGESLDEMKIFAKKIEEILKKQKGVTGTEIDYEEGMEQLVVNVNDAEAQRLGLSTQRIAIELRNIYGGDEVTKIRNSDEDIDIIVQANEKARSDLKSLNDVHILNNQGRRIQLNKVAKVVKGPGAFVIRRKNRKRTISISGQLDKSIATPVGLTKKMRPLIDDLLKGQEDLDYNMGGENEDTQESLQGLMKAGLIAFFLIFIILVTMFGSIGQPLIIMSAIPLGMIGVVFTFLVFGKPFSFMALMGVIGLIGVVVNDSIVLVTFINKKYKELGIAYSAVKEAALSRFRAVILTTFTTVAGLLPIAHAKGGDPFLKPMALSFAYGLVFSTALTLLFVPCSYIAYRKMIEFFSRRNEKAMQELAMESN